MKALSIKQPWAWLIVNGFKDIENRTWKTNFRGEFLIHASKKPDNVDWHFIRESMNDDKAFGMLWYEKETSDAFFGGIVGRASIVDCVNRHDSKWFFGPFGFILKDAEPLDFVSYKGKLGFFEVE